MASFCSAASGGIRRLVELNGQLWSVAGGALLLQPWREKTEGCKRGNRRDCMRQRRRSCAVLEECGDCPEVFHPREWTRAAVAGRAERRWRVGEAGQSVAVAAGMWQRR